MVASSSETGEVLVGLSDSLAGAVERSGASVVSVFARHRLPSSGVHWREGIVVTADHTVEREEGITVGLPDGRTVQAALAGRDSGTDLAVLRIEGTGLPVAQISSAPLRVGHIVLAVGRPGEAGLSTSWGAVSAVGGPWRTWSGGQIDQLIRPDLTLYPGFSGGPLVDASGQVAGINTSGLSRSMTLAIPVSTVERVVDALLSKGHVARGYLGVGMQPVRLPENLAQATGQEVGLIVISVESGGPAERAGVLVGDILIGLGGRPVTDTEDVQASLGAETVGQPLAARLIRGGQPVDLTLTVGERPRRGA